MVKKKTYEKIGKVAVGYVSLVWIIIPVSILLLALLSKKPEPTVGLGTQNFEDPYHANLIRVD